MGDFIRKARSYYIAGEIAERNRDFDVASSNYFKSLAAINDFVLSKEGLFPKDHNERFNMLKEKFQELYRITSSLFLTYRRAYTSDISKEEISVLKEKIKGAFKNARIAIPTDFEVEKYIKEAHKG